MPDDLVDIILVYHRTRVLFNRVMSQFNDRLHDVSDDFLYAMTDDFLYGQDDDRDRALDDWLSNPSNLLHAVIEGRGLFWWRHLEQSSTSCATS